MNEEAIRWDDDRAAAILGRVALIGVTGVHEGGTHQEQMFGTVTSAIRGHSIEIALAGSRAGKIYTLPPDTAVFRDAPPGDYRLRSTGEVVVDPDFLLTYEVHPPSHTEG